MAGIDRTIVDWVASELQKRSEVGADGIQDITGVDVDPTGRRAACTLTIGPGGATQVDVVELATGARSRVVPDLSGAYSPRWSPSGDRVCVLADDAAGRPQAVVVAADDLAVAVAISEESGSVEMVSWSPDGRRLALVVAEPGAEISDVYGSGVVGGSSASWAPRVSPAESGRRRLVVWDLTTGASRVLGDLNAWEISWAWDDTVLVLASADAGEGAWYGAHLALVSAVDGRSLTMLSPRHQLAQPRVEPSGRRWSVLSGVASDRGLLAGEVLVATDDAQPRAIDTAGAHVTDYAWTGDAAIVFIGMAGLDTVVGRWDADSGQTTVLWKGPQSSGRHQPEVAVPAAGEPVLVMEHHDMPPTLGVVRDGAFQPVMAVDGPGPRHVLSHTGTTTQLTWTSDDGQDVQGLLTVPSTEGPHPLVVNVHGGPIAAWHDGWIGRDHHTSLLVARGYAVLRPNPRGSTGRGADWAEAVVGDIGGRDVEDVTSGVRHLVAEGLVDPSRVGLTGNSYGGYMAAWVPCVSDIFAATVSRSPVTDWRSQHFTSNLAEFDQMILTGDPMDPTSQYATRSPVDLAERISTPILLTAGALDLACPPSQAQYLHTRLVELGTETQLVIYPEEGHGVRHPDAVADQAARVIAWFERFMPSGR
ncbi:S9 family peptidase [Aeromicrobium fastidiosum]|uniref:S9 family peptidase n=1 Tax=Aeromicrobium fastidiosum TaxID=52699 RepID=A0A641AHU4_9ACTN|nr:prolyl oligopeptidase family serine peptidase [Aeromicrobium fastidiosum]KAA1373076.1 S9 family peptidase [Aeromicrobium fastidiosum]MBP2391060.1 dipeptidyl aminopeptidase/acylaminoacyl peptidase [Aeromicrobium fastidiosum]